MRESTTLRPPHEDSHDPLNARQQCGKHQGTWLAERTAEDYPARRQCHSATLCRRGNDGSKSQNSPIPTISKPIATSAKRDAGL
jgi:hypothetical protein